MGDDMHRISGEPPSPDETGRNRVVRRPWLVFLGCTIFLILLISLVLVHYRVELEKIFYNMAVVQLNSYTEGEKQEVEAYLDSIDNNLQAIRLLAESSSMSLEQGVFTWYLDRFNQENEYTVTYIPIEELERELNRPGSMPGDRIVFEQLREGKKVLSEIRYSNRLAGYYFGYGVPVTRQNHVVGAVRCIVDASKLMETKQIITQHSLIASYIVEGDGILDYARMGEGKTAPVAETHIFELLPSGGKRLMEPYGNMLQDGMVTEMIAKKNGLMTFFSSTPLGHHDWYIINVTQAGGLLRHTKTIMRNMIISSMVLIAIVVVFGIVAYGVYNAQSRQISFESERYQLLSEFSDTVLMQYYYDRDTLELTANVKNRFDADSLCKERYLTGEKPLLKVKEGDWEAFREFLQNPGADGEIRHTKLRILDKTQNYLWCSLQIRYVYEKNRLVAAVGKMTDISSQKELEEKLVWEAQMDGLTGIYNKATAKKKIADLLERQETGYLFMIDVDNFKEVNDTYGHARGDEVLHSLGMVLQETFRAGDVIGRIGGDEFAAYVNCGNHQDFHAAKRAELILERLRECQKDWGAAVTVSIGIASCPEDGKTYKELYMAADRAMYIAKRKGKNQYCIFRNHDGEMQW